jgi:RNA polymerase sigma-70 factor, ECF subfamily
MTRSVSDENCVAMGDRQGELSEGLLVSAAKSGDRGAFVALCERHSNKIARRIYRITRNWQDAEDVLQDSFMKAFIHLKNFEGKSSFSSWLTRIAINSALMILRKKRSLEIPIDHISDDPEMWHAWEPRDLTEDPESSCVRREREELLWGAILQLRPIFRDVIQLRHAQECSTNEIAQILGISVAAAKSRLLRARTVLRASIPLKEIGRLEDDWQPSDH